MKQSIVCFLLLTLYQCSLLMSQNSINKIELKNSSAIKNIDILIAGHTYGAFSKSVFPDPHFTYFLDNENLSKYTFCSLLGDIYRCQEENDILFFKKNILNKFSIPVFNAIGNHDLGPSFVNRHQQDYSNYHDLFSKNTYFSFELNRNKFIFLDSELSNNQGSIIDKQLSFLASQLDQLDSTINVFIFCHKELFLFENNFEKEVLPLFNKASNQSNLYFISGDGKKNSPNTYYFKENNVHYIHTHLNDSREDRILTLNIDSLNNVKFKTIQLITGQIESLKIMNPIKKESNHKHSPTNEKVYLFFTTNKKPIFFGFLLGLISTILMFKILIKN